MMISIAIPALNIAIKQLDWQLANETLKALCGHTVRLHIKPPEMIFDVTFTPEYPVIHTKLDGQPDCTITLSPSDALKMSLDQKAHISFNGDIHVATHFKNLLKQSSLSIESLCSQWLPEHMVYPSRRILRYIQSTIQQVKTSLEDQCSHYIIVELQHCPSQKEINRFDLQVQQLRERLDRIEAMIQ